ncbi:hypothetical protein MPHL43072_17430 [Mycolicibacterium phlei DSM 43072]|uniref:Uncharacterized protein n=1 Tax=Mycolicibacterium phlei DSM 43239 = CCUG 21000 TaxID=1226750 RepID=A0A5N5V3I1_MYCPH|nr:hypothetical protein MPHL21000_11945 [Mycolicibacterium phlei DSM 43239 = CCUG 21000]KXW61723.1 hypothetical protein MPHL43239_19635 [Mycolicibacterium phlei DSM 43239 = CCUG 21000]KXW65541.1 hypothetical protein MPHL43070_05000 [Mycolicibacterium phlei DSM 43070]KXW70897.1 hypothetical protein MPHL43072_17430 [Mycolicibacterium phlei DSM 43072]
MYRIFGWLTEVSAHRTHWIFPVCGIGILIFCKYVIQ